MWQGKKAAVVAITPWFGGTAGKLTHGRARGRIIHFGMSRVNRWLYLDIGGGSLIDAESQAAISMVEAAFIDEGIFPLSI